MLEKIFARLQGKKKTADDVNTIKESENKKLEKEEI